MTPLHPKVADVVEGGGTRAASVKAGLRRLLGVGRVELVACTTERLVSCALVRALVERMQTSPRGRRRSSLTPTDTIKRWM